MLSSTSFGKTPSEEEPLFHFGFSLGSLLQGLSHGFARTHPNPPGVHGLYLAWRKVWNAKRLRWPVVVQLLSGDSSTVTLHELKPGEIFLIERNSLRLFTTCMVGYVPSVPFTPANHDAINIGRYHCVKQ